MNDLILDAIMAGIFFLIGHYNGWKVGYYRSRNKEFHRFLEQQAVLAQLGEKDSPFHNCMECGVHVWERHAEHCFALKEKQDKYAEAHEV